MKTRFFLLVLLALTLTSCQSFSLADLVTPSGGRLYWDDFSDPASGSWPEVSTSSSTLGFADGAYRMTVLEPNYQVWAISGYSYRNVRVEADMTRNAGPLINMMGLICRYQDGDNFYFFIVSSDGYYAVGKVRAGEITLVGQEMMAFSAAIRRDDNHLRFDCVDSTLTGYVNDTMVAKTDDAAFRDGDTGLTSGAFEEAGVDVSFDNFVVYKP